MYIYVYMYIYMYIYICIYICRGCDKITDAGLLSMTETVMDRHQHKYPMCETFKHLDMSYCSGVTSGCLKV
jgi:hypothetical protein